jgi:hypothetical protein
MQTQLEKKLSLLLYDQSLRLAADKIVMQGLQSVEQVKSPAFLFRIIFK